ncbi:hypothetical protein [Inquilinus sp. CAU 1745]|uniref:hypothetical protein n=1 Tax=Inquilinus sp. CAU 1745 TaxID=3140369 RepID=UPI00325A75DA
MLDLIQHPYGIDGRPDRARFLAVGDGGEGLWIPDQVRNDQKTKQIGKIIYLTY